MTKIVELGINDSKNLYQDLTKGLYPYHEQPAGSILAIVEGTKELPIIGLRYPGRKLVKRHPKVVRSNTVHWANLYDFEVVPFSNGKELTTERFTYQVMLEDFQDNKSQSEDFWSCLETVYETNEVPKKIPRLGGIDTELYLRVLKWIWVQEDFNYRLKWDEVGSPERYVLQNRTGTRTSSGAGRAKFYAALILLKHHFTFNQVKKIIPLY